MQPQITNRPKKQYDNASEKDTKVITLYTESSQVHIVFQGMKKISSDELPIITQEISARSKEQNDEAKLELSFSYNNLTDKDCETLSTSSLQKIYILDLQHNRISAEGCFHLSSINWGSLKTLVLTNNLIGSKGCKYLARSKCINLQILGLSHNSIGDQGCKYLSKSQWKKLAVLYLSSNQLGDESCLYLAKLVATYMEKIEFSKLFNTKRRIEWALIQQNHCLMLPTWNPPQIYTYKQKIIFDINKMNQHLNNICN